MPIEITGPCRVKLRNGDTLTIGHNGDYSWPGRYMAMNLWRRDGRFCRDGLESPYDIVEVIQSEPSAPPIEPAATVEPKLEEPLSEGLWWTDLDLGGKAGRLKVEVVAVALFGGYAAAWTTPFDKIISPVMPDGRFGSSRNIQLIRRVIEPTVAPLTPKQAASLLTETIRRKRDGKQYRVTAVSLGNVTLWPPGMPCSDAIEVPNERLADKYEHLDGSPCGVVSADPWDDPA